MERNLHILLDWLLPGKGGSLCSWRGHWPSGVVSDPLPGGLCPGEEPWRKHASSPDSLGVSPVGSLPCGGPWAWSRSLGC